MAAALLIAAAATVPLGWGHTPVARVVLEAPGAQDLGELRRIFGVAPGAPLSRAELRGGVQALMASGEVEDVRVSVEEEKEGAVVIVHVQAASRVRGVTITGLPRWAAKRVRGTLSLIRGAPLNVPGFELNLGRAVEQLRSEGYPHARLDPDLDFDLARGSVRVRVSGDLGKPLTLTRVAVQGFELPAGRLWKVCSLKHGQILAQGSLERARRLLAEFIRREGFWEAEVEQPAVGVGEAGAVLRLSVRPGPHYLLKLDGIKRSKALEQEALPFLRGDEPFSEAELELLEHRVRVFLQRQGKLLAETHAELAPSDGDRLLTLHVKSGPTTPVEAVRFPGAHAFKESLLKERVGARVGHPWRWGGEAVDDETLAADVSSLLGTLREAGFADAKVDTPRIVPDGDGVAIEFPLTEGERRLVSEVHVEGTPEALHLPTLALRPRGPWSLAAEEGARNSVESVLQEAGYLDAHVVATHDCTDGNCSVVLHATPGTPAVLGQVVIAGLACTRLSVVETVAGLHEGSTAGPEAQLAAQRRLLGLGIFQRVAIHPIPGQEFGPRRGVVIDVSEAPTRAFGLGLGWDNVAKARISLSWLELNVFGTGRSLSFDTRLSSTEQRFQVSYREPARLGLLGFPTWVSVYRSQEQYTDYGLLRRGMWVEFGDRLRRPTRALLRYDYQIVRPTAPEAVLSTLERDKQNLAIASITPILEWDTRDDLFAPRKGVYASLQLQNAFRAFIADAAFEAVSASVSAFTPFAGGVLASSARGGAIHPRARCGDPCQDDNLLLPIGVRLFAGGRISNRAFPTDLLGIRGETLFCKDGTTTCKEDQLEAVGGAGLLLTSLEWRFPVVSVVGGDVFVDGGNVWPSWREVRTAEMRWGAGLGLRVETPVGPIRLEYGWKLNRQVGESPGALFLSFGNPF